MKIALIPLLLAAFTAVMEMRAATYGVSTAAEFNALPALAAGDLVVLQSGTYGALDKVLVSTIPDDATALAAPILVLAAIPGAVDVVAPSRITLQGRGIVLAGLDFIAGSGMRDNGSSNPAWLIATAADSRYMRLSNVRFLHCDAGDDYGHWIYCEGFHHTIEYCSFEGKDEPNANATVAFKRSTSEAGIATPREHLLRGCYFGPRIGSASENGYETIRIGDSSSQAHDMRVTIEDNVFYRTLWRTDGQKPNDTEIISNKTKGNRIRHNTFLESHGQITLRHGDACLVEGNYIFGGGTYSGGTIVLNPANPHQGGIRIIGQDHVVRNNYLVNLAGVDLRAALCLMAGAATWTDGNGSGGDNGYETASNSQIYNNTFLACRALTLGYVDTGSLQPTGVRIYNNAWQGSGPSNGIVRHAAFTPAGSGGNYIYHPSGGGSLGWTGLGGTYTSVFSPQIVEDFDGYTTPSATSPLLGAADATLSATDDVRGLPRPATARDIGCFEREIPGTGRPPLLRGEVGPVFDGGPAGTYPTPGDTSPVITTTLLPDGLVGSTYQQTLAAAAGDGILNWSLLSGTLPPGLSISSSGLLKGTPTTTGTSTFTVKVTDTNGDEDTQALALTVSTGGSAPSKFNVSSVLASADDGNVPANTLDGNLATRWSAQGDGQWIRYDLGRIVNVQFLKLAWHQGASRIATFDVEVSPDATNWIALTTGRQSSGTTTALELVELPDTFARYVRIVGHGNSTSAWNSITETEIWGTPTPIAPTELLAPAVTHTGSNIRLTIPSILGRTYRLQATDSLTLAAWQTIAGPTTGPGGPIFFEDPAAMLLPARFYRLLIDP